MSFLTNHFLTMPIITAAQKSFALFWFLSAAFADVAYVPHLTNWAVRIQDPLRRHQQLKTLQYDKQRQ